MRNVSTNLVHAQVLAPYERLLRRGGAPAERIFGSCGIPVDAVFDSEAIITMRQAHRFCESASRYTGEESLGSTVARQLELEELGATDSTIRRSATFFDARSAIQTVVHAAEPGSRLWMEQDKERAWFCYRPERRFSGGIQSELFDLQCLLKFIRLAAGEEWTPEVVQMTTGSRSHLRGIPEFANAAIRRHDRTTAMAFPKPVLSRPLTVAPRAQNLDSTEQATRSVMEENDVPAAVTVVMNSLSRFEPIPSLDQMADRFGVTGRTMQRALEDGDTSYRQLAERELFRRATDLLSNERLSVKSISNELGYASPNGFIRAFSRIAGVTPMAYRRQVERGA